METSTQWQLARDSALRYQEILVPAILGPAALTLVEAARLAPGEAVLDVGCGTGAAARLAAGRVGASGRVVGVDVNPGMVGVARSLRPVGGAVVEWFEGNAGELPFGAGEFDAVLCAQTLQFLQDRPAALEEMRRVLRASGRVALSCWSELAESPYFHALVEAVSRHISTQTAAGLRSAFDLCDADHFRRLVVAAGFRNVDTQLEAIELALPRAEEFVPRHVAATPMSAGFAAATQEARQAVVAEVADRMAPYETEDGVLVPFRTLVVVGWR